MQQSVQARIAKLQGQIMALQNRSRSVTLWKRYWINEVGPCVTVDAICKRIGKSIFVYTHRGCGATAIQKRLLAVNHDTIVVERMDAASRIQRGAGVNQTLYGFDRIVGLTYDQAKRRVACLITEDGGILPARRCGI